MSRFQPVLKKELKELSRERIVILFIVGPLIIYLLIGAAAAQAGSQITKQTYVKPRVIIVVEPGWTPGNVSNAIAEAFGTHLTQGDPSEYLRNGYDAAIILPNNFDSRILSGEQVKVGIIYKPRSLSFLELQRPEQISQILESAVRKIIALKVKSVLPEANASYIEEPVISETRFYVRGEIVGYQRLLALIMGAALAVPLSVIIVAVASMQVAAVSLGLEKEAKTLEKLFTLPISKKDLFIGKLLSVYILSLFATASYMAGFVIYIKLSVKGFSPDNMPQASISIPGEALVVTIIGLAIIMYINTVIGFIVGSQTGDVRSSQLASSYVAFILAIPIFPLFFGVDLTQLSGPVKLLLAVDPYAIFGMMAPNSLMGNIGFSFVLAGGLLMHAVFWTIVALRILDPEYLIIGHPLLKRLVEKMVPSSRRRSISTS